MRSLPAAFALLAGCASDGSLPSVPRPGGAERLYTQSWIVEPNVADTYLGSDVATADVNGDGYDDVLVGAMAAGADGRAEVYLGSPTGPGLTPDWVVAPDATGSSFGTAVASAGDVNGDGYDDVLVGDPYASNGASSEGRAHLYLGGAAGPAATAAWTVEGEQSTAHLGEAVASAGDVNGDGYDDVLVGAPDYDASVNGEGKALLFLGSAIGLSAVPAWTVVSAEPGAHLGSDVASAGDVNGDGYDDVLVGARTAADADGAAYLHLGSASGPSVTPDWTATGTSYYGYFGEELLGAVDLDGDGYDDVAIAGSLDEGGTQYDEGRASVFFGSASGLPATPGFVAEGNAISVNLGWSLAAADLNGDGHPELVAGGDNRFSVFLGSATGPSPRAWVETGDQSSSYFGSAVATGDVNGDGQGDLLVGAYVYDAPENGEGRVYGYFGGCDADDDGACDTLDACFGADVTGDPDSDGVCDDVDLCPGGDDRVDTDRDLLPEACDGCVGDDDEGDTDADLVCDDLDECEGDDATGDPDGDHWCGDVDLCVGENASGDSDGDGECDVNAVWYGGGGLAQGSSLYGAAVASAGDVNGDGYDDVAVGEPRDSYASVSGSVHVYHGSPTGLAPEPSWTATDGQLAAYFGTAVASAGDVNGDGYDDLVVGASAWDGGQTNEGRVSLFLGSPAGLAASPSWTAEVDVAAASFGSAVASAGDVNGDGYDDVLVGADAYSNGQTNEGGAWLYLGSAAGLAATAAWSVQSDQVSAWLGSAVASAGDVNGDGCDDVLVSAYAYDGPEIGEGRVWLYLGGPAGPDTVADWIGEPDQAGASYGDAVAGAGDVNGDGYDDVLVGSPNWSGDQTMEGRAWLYFGSATGPSATPDWTDESDQAYFNCYYCVDTARYGVGVGAAGDLNGDGYDDVLVGAPSLTSTTGVVFAYLGSPTGPGPTADLELREDLRGDGNYNYANLTDDLGSAVAFAGDVDGDGYDDVIAGAPASSEPWNYPYGSALLFHGSCLADADADGVCDPVDPCVGCVSGGQAGERFGASVACAGDVDGDGKDDLAVGAFAWDGGQLQEGRAAVHLGTTGGIGPGAAWSIEGDQTGAFFGQAVGSAGDVDADGFADLLVGAPGFDGGQADEGRATLYRGSASGLATLPSWTAEGDGAGAELGLALASAGDTDGDGVSDVVVGAPGWSDGQTAEGQVRWFRGAPAGLEVVPAWTAVSNGVSFRLGAAVSGGDVDGDGYADLLAGAPGFTRGQAREGRAYAVLGGATGPGPTPAWTTESDEIGARLGASVAYAGDVDGDGFGDLLVGAPGHDGGESDEGRALLFLGAAAGPGASPAWTFEPDQASALLGRTVAAAADRNGDGFADVLVGAPGWSGGEAGEGRVQVWLGGSPPFAVLALSAEGGVAGAALSRWSGGACDLDGDGYDDVAAGAPGDAGGTGVVHLFLGGP